MQKLHQKLWKTNKIPGDTRNFTLELLVGIRKGEANTVGVDPEVGQWGGGWGTGLRGQGSAKMLPTGQGGDEEQKSLPSSGDNLHEDLTIN